MKNSIDRYILSLSSGSNSRYTVRNYSSDLLGNSRGGGFLQYCERRNIQDIYEVDRQLVRDYLTYLTARGIEKVSLCRKLSAIRGFYRFLLSEGTIEQAPIPTSGKGSLISPKRDQRLPEYLTEQETEKLLSMPDNSNIGKRDKALLEVLYASGMRISELCNLNLSDISKDEIRVTGKGDKERVVLLGNQAINALVSYLQVRPMTKQRALFVSIRGQRLGIRAIQKMVSNYAKMAGIQKRIHPHTLRHSFATHMLNGGADLRVVQELLGHADLSTTQIYTHLTSSKVRDRYLDCHPGSKE